MTELEFYCTICGDEWRDYYDAVAHVYNGHDVCGTRPGLHVEWREQE